ncbi:MAG: alpha/beta hydrolase [Caldilineaceae bacterium]
MDGITINYETFGSGRPLLMFHGASLDHRHMMTDMEPIFIGRNGWQRYYVDLPGHGQTLATDWLSTQNHVLDVLLRFIDTVIGQQRFVLVGCSYGGYLAQGIVSCRASQLDGVFLHVPAVNLDREARKLPNPVKLLENPQLVNEAEKIDPRAGEAIKSQVVQHRAVLEWWLNNSRPAKETFDDDFLDKIYEPENRNLSVAICPLPIPFPGPTLILVGKQDTSVGFEDQWQLLESYPRATFAALDRAGHLLSVHQRELFRALVTEWLDRVEEYISS